MRPITSVSKKKILNDKTFVAPADSTRQGTGILELPKHTQASKSVNTVDIHRTATADAFSAASPESKSRIQFILDTNKRVEDHRAGLVQVQLVSLHLRLLCWVLGTPTINMEGFI